MFDAEILYDNLREDGRIVKVFNEFKRKENLTSIISLSVFLITLYLGYIYQDNIWMCMLFAMISVISIAVIIVSLATFKSMYSSKIDEVKKGVNWEDNLFRIMIDSNINKDSYYYDDELNISWGRFMEDVEELITIYYNPKLNKEYIKLNHMIKDNTNTINFKETPEGYYNLKELRDKVSREDLLRIRQTELTFDTAINYLREESSKRVKRTKIH